MTTAKSPGSDKTALNPGLWWVLLVLYLCTAVGFSIIQPLGRCPDEGAHMDYVRFLAREHRFPIWAAAGGGEAGYESQHPPLYYGIAALVYSLTGSLEERWRWQILRWATIGIGVALFFLCRQFFRRFFDRDGDQAREDGRHFESNQAAFIATATVLLMPLTILYTGYINPDGLTMLGVSVALYLSWLTLSNPPSAKRAALLGFVCGLIILTKLSGAPIVLIALAAQLLVPVKATATEEKDSAINAGFKGRFTLAALLLATFAVTSGWWYVRNQLLYGTAFIHTEGRLGTGQTMAANAGVPATAWFTWRETYLSTWAQRGWFPEGLWTVALYGIIIALNLAALAGFVGRRRREDGTNVEFEQAKKYMLRLSALLIALVFLGHQWAFWTIDVEFNAGGRYMLVAIVAIALLLVAGLSRLKILSRPVWPLWVGLLLLMNLVSAWNIDTVLNPRYAPNWEPFHFPPGEER